MEDDSPSSWRQITNIPGAFINESAEIIRNGKQKKHTLNKKLGYKVVTFSVDGKSKTKYVHRMLLEAFLGQCPDGCEALHLNGDRLDNRLSNLRWGTRKENVADAIRHGTATIGSRNGAAKLSQNDLSWIRDMKDMGFLPNEICLHFEVSAQTIRRVFNGNTYKGEFA